MLVMEEVNLDVPTGNDLPTHGEEETTEVKRELRDLRPAHYLFNIENFSLISDAKIDSYESGEFEVDGYKWKLCVYPEGKKKVNEEGHISLYLTLSESNSLPLHREVNVSFKLFAYNQILDKYLSVQDAKERVRRFRGTIREWGFDQFVPLNVFNDASNGYLVDDCCIFGAEVFVLDPTSKGECVSIVKKHGNSTFTWKFKYYAQTKGGFKFHRSPEFVIGGFKWTLRLYPNGHAKEEAKSLSMYLCWEGYESRDPEERLHVRFIMRIKNQIQGTKDHERLANKQYHPQLYFSGFEDLMPLSYLKEPCQGYVNPDGNMIVELQILMLTVIRDFS